MEVTHDANTLCYVVMPDHVHWLVQLQEGASLSGAVQKVKSLTSKMLHSFGLWSRHIWGLDIFGSAAFTIMLCVPMKIWLR